MGSPAAACLAQCASWTSLVQLTQPTHWVGKRRVESCLIGNFSLLCFKALWVRRGTALAYQPVTFAQMVHPSRCLWKVQDMLALRSLGAPCNFQLVTARAVLGRQLTHPDASRLLRSHGDLTSRNRERQLGVPFCLLALCPSGCLETVRGATNLKPEPWNLSLHSTRLTSESLSSEAWSTLPLMGTRGYEHHLEPLGPQQALHLAS